MMTPRMPRRPAIGDIGTHTVTVQVSDGLLPSWLDFDENTGVLSGMPTAIGDVEVSLSVKDDNRY
jgi:hypothetical protein